MQKNKRKMDAGWKAALIVMGCGAAIALAFAVGLVAMLSQLLDNPYTDAGYPGWQEVRLTAIDPFRLPGEWQLTVQTGAADKAGTVATSHPVTLTDADGALLARGVYFSSRESEVQLMRALTEIAGFPVTEYGTGSGLTTTVLGKRGNCLRWVLQGDGQRVQMICLELGDVDGALYLFFPLDNPVGPGLMNIAQGVINSYREAE